MEISDFHITPEIARFRQQPHLVAKLRDLLEDSTMQLALAAVRSMSEMRSIPKQVAGVHYDTTIAHATYHTLGVHHTLKTLQMMATSGGVHGTDLPDEDQDFMHVLPKDMLVDPRVTKAS